MITGVAKGEAVSLSKADGVRVITRALLPVCFQVPCKRLILECPRYKVQIEKSLPSGKTCRASHALISLLMGWFNLSLHGWQTAAADEGSRDQI